MLVHFELKITIKLQNCDALFSLEFVRVHSTLIANFDPSVTQERVNQGGFAVIDVGNNGNVSNVLIVHSSFLKFIFNQAGSGK